jgi:glucokinase
VTFVNDATAAAYGEFWVGTGKAFDSLVLFTLGTGIGCGIIINGEPIHGQHSHGAECGHIVIDYQDDARVCSCGRKGHLEGYASALAIIKRTRERLDAGTHSSLAERIHRGDDLSPLLLWEEAEQGDELSLRIIMETAMFIGVGVVNMMNIIDPDGIVLGGAMNFGGPDTKVGRRFLARVREEVQSRAFPLPAAKTVVDFASLEGDAGYIGAAGIARRDFHRAG